MTRCSRYVFEVVGRGCEFAAVAVAPVCVGWSPKRELYVLYVSPYLFYDTKTDFYDPSEWRFWNESKNNVYSIFCTRCFDVRQRRGEKTNIKIQTVFLLSSSLVSVCVIKCCLFFQRQKGAVNNIIFRTLYIIGTYLFVLMATILQSLFVYYTKYCIM